MRSEYNKNDQLKGLRIEALSSDGAGIAKEDGFPIFIKDALPGDVVSAKITKVRKNMAFARLESVDEPSPDRVDPRCPVSRACGGCVLQELSYEKQLEYKDEKVYNCLLRIGGIPAKILDAAHEDPIGMDKPWRYRNKAQYPIGRDRNGQIIAGFYAGRTHHIVESAECHLNPSEFAAILRIFLGFCEENKISPYDEESDKGCVRHLLIRKGFNTGELMIMPIVRDMKTFDDKMCDKLKETLLGIPGVATIVINENSKRTNVILGEKYRTIYGPGYIVDEMGGLRFRISPSSFYQVNTEQALKIYDKALEYAGLSGTEKVYDLCCGIGTISLYISRKAGYVHGVEISETAIEDAKKNAALNEISNVDFTAAPAEEYLPKACDLSADVVILDPPRSGMERAALDAIVSAAPSRIVYISCDPATLARDIKVFMAAGYRLSRFVAVDQFCHTSHVETVCLLSNRKPDARVKIDVDLEDYYRIKDEQKKNKASE
ncbi:MAG: 23S rRNA (uracil(1939)-C(5))-methyltransferase RlmD [Lachnospiraceae bacterium]|nr:23S rRNA (uracil(1939)-C(5))-methyltransferase RlmD [Lachnospiraceae bacterium]